MIFMKLTDLAGSPVYVSREHIIWMVRHHSAGRTIIMFAGSEEGDYLSVQETPEVIVEMAGGVITEPDEPDVMELQSPDEPDA